MSGKKKKIVFSSIFFFSSFLSHLTTPQRHLFEPLISQPITFYTQQPQQQRHLVAPRQAQVSSQQQQQLQHEQQQTKYIWQNFINPLTFNTPFDSFEPEAEFVPLEAQQQHNLQNPQQHGRNTEEKPFGK